MDVVGGRTKMYRASWIHIVGLTGINNARLYNFKEFSTTYYVIIIISFIGGIYEHYRNLWYRTQGQHVQHNKIIFEQIQKRDF